MSVPTVRRFPDGHFRRVIFDFGAFIADYPEQVMLAGIVQGWCPKYVNIPRLWLLLQPLTSLNRCTAQPSDIDGAAGPRTNDLLDKLLGLEISTYTMLWDEYGIDSSAIVSSTFGVQHIH